jgi:hypothetical protein
MRRVLKICPVSEQTIKHRLLRTYSQKIGKVKFWIIISIFSGVGSELAFLHKRVLIRVVSLPALQSTTTANWELYDDFKNPIFIRMHPRSINDSLRFYQIYQILKS